MRIFHNIIIFIFIVIPLTLFFILICIPIHQWEKNKEKPQKHSKTFTVPGGKEKTANFIFPKPDGRCTAPTTKGSFAVSLDYPTKETLPSSGNLRSSIEKVCIIVSNHDEKPEIKGNYLKHKNDHKSELNNNSTTYKSISDEVYDALLTSENKKYEPWSNDYLHHNKFRNHWYYAKIQTKNETNRLKTIEDTVEDTTEDKELNIHYRYFTYTE
jgi:hypothetical protein